jgi:hypothetical protein
MDTVVAKMNSESGYPAADVAAVGDVVLVVLSVVLFRHRLSASSLTFTLFAVVGLR